MSLISKNSHFGGLAAFIFQAARSSEKSVPRYQSTRPICIRVLEFLSLLLCQNFQILHMYNLFEVAVKACINAFLFIQLNTNNIHDLRILF
jgi:hypothetical protein